MRVRFPATLLATATALVFAAALAQACPMSCGAKSACAAPAAKSTTSAAVVAPSAPLPSAAQVLAPALPFAPLPSASTPVYASGLVAFLDPETGLLTGSISDLVVPGDLAALQHAAATPLAEVQLANGSWMVDLQGSIQDYYVLNVDAFGRRTVVCTPEPLEVSVPSLPVALPTTPTIAER